MSRASTLGCVVFSLLLCACSKGGGGKASLPAESAPQVTSVRAVKPAARLASGVARVSGQIRSRNEATLGTKITAQVRRVEVDVGDRVKQGQVLVVLDSTNAGIALQNAQAAERAANVAVQNAKVELDRGKTLHGQGAITDAALERAQAAHDAASAQQDQARAAVRASRQQITDATVVAPFAGVVAARLVGAGDTVTAMPPTPLISITDPDRLEVRLAVPEALTRFARPGDVLAGRASPGDVPFKAAVRVAAPVVDPQTRTVEVIGDIQADPASAALLRPGAMVEVDFAQAESLVGPFLPAQAVRQEGAASYVLVVAKGKLERKEVVVEKINPGTVRVLRGLAAEEQVVVDADETLRPGDAVAILAD